MFVNCGVDLGVLILSIMFFSGDCWCLLMMVFGVGCSYLVVGAGVC